jgi:hypothetical protein
MAKGNRGPVFQMMLVNTKTLGAILFVVIAVLVACHTIVMTCYWDSFCMGSRGAILDFGYLFDLSKGKNVPTWFSTTLLTAVGLLLAMIALMARRQAAASGAWAALSAMFVGLSLAETAELYWFWDNLMSGPALIGAADAAVAGIILGTVTAALVVLAFWRWIWTLPAPTRVMFILAGVVYVTGGLGFAFLGIVLADETFFNPAYLVVSTMEEALEMAAVTIMLIGVVDHAQGMNSVSDGSEPWYADNHAQAMVGPEGLEPPTKAL